MKMVNMAMKGESGGGMPATEVQGEGPKYPYGLQLSLGTEELKALGIGSMPAVGGMMMMHAAVKVTGCSEREMEGGEKEQRCELQITDMGMEPEKEKKRTAGEMAETMYGQKAG